MKYTSKHDRKTEERIIESLIGQKHLQQVLSGNVGAIKKKKDTQTIAKDTLGRERIVNALNPEHKKFNDKRNAARRRKRKQEKSGMSDQMREILDKHASATELVSQFADRGKTQ